jgi:multimeric flavodoxin WrbA
MQRVYEKLETANAVVLGTPIYWYGPSAQMKSAIDRLRPYFGNGRLQGKALGLLLPAGSGPGDCDLTEAMAIRMAGALQMRYAGAVMVEAYDEGDVDARSGVTREIEDLFYGLS